MKHKRKNNVSGKKKLASGKIMLYIIEFYALVKS